MTEEHPFAPYLRIVGKGPNLSRALERDEARGAMRMIAAGEVEPEQLGAFLLLLRYRGETGAEIAGFIEGAREVIDAPGAAAADLDWPSYADRHRQQPWFVLAALLLAENGVRVLMHGIDGYHEGYAPTRPVLAALGIEPAPGLADAARRLETHNIAYAGLEDFCPAIERLFHLRPTLGLRTVVNTFARALNPLGAPAQVQGVVHPPYRDAHQETALLLGQPRMAVFKGGGGEVQRNPLKPCEVFWVRDGAAGTETWPAILPDTRYDWRGETLETDRVAALWRGEIAAPAPEAAITATAALALHTLGRAATMDEAQAMAEAMWVDRPRSKYAA